MHPKLSLTNPPVQLTPSLLKPCRVYLITLNCCCLFFVFFFKDKVLWTLWCGLSRGLGPIKLESLEGSNGQRPGLEYTCDAPKSQNSKSGPGLGHGVGSWGLNIKPG